MKNKNTYSFLRCLKNIVLIGVITSLAAAFLASQFPRYTIITIISALSNGIFIVLNLLCMLKFRLCVKGTRAFYLNNLLATAIYCGIGVVYSVVLHFVNSPNGILSAIYARVFFNFKIFHFISFNRYTYSIGTVASTLIFSAICFFIVLIFPLIVNSKVKRKLKKSNIFPLVVSSNIRKKSKNRKK